MPLRFAPLKSMFLVLAVSAAAFGCASGGTDGSGSGGTHVQRRHVRLGVRR